MTPSDLFWAPEAHGGLQGQHVHRGSAVAEHTAPVSSFSCNSGLPGQVRPPSAPRAVHRARVRARGGGHSLL